MFKNASPRKLAFYAAVTISAIFLLIVTFLKVTDLIQSTKLVFLLLVLTCFFSAYFVFFYLLKLYIYRRIKLIYKNIHSFKRAPEDKNVSLDMDEDIISEVDKEVSEWATNKQKEIESLRSLATYRRNFMGNISHELKTPIFNIQGYLHTLLEGGIYDEKINFTYLNRAAKNVERLHTIVEDLESIARLESGELMLDMQTFDLHELVAEVFEELEVMAHNNHTHLVFKEGADGHFQVVADRENIRQVLINLVSNSIKYGKDKGTTKVAFYDMDSYILVEVADNGIGVSEEHLPHLFDRFYRADKSRSRTQGGSGLGLSIVKHIIEAHKQTINVRSTPGLGSTFGFTLQKA